jgi:N-acetylmuramoyl-L-alanine amidase
MRIRICWLTLAKETLMGNSIVVCDKKYNIGTRVVLWDEPGGMSAYDTTAYETSDRKTGEIMVVKGKRYKSRLALGSTPNLDRLKKVVWEFALHHSGLYRSRDTYETLQQRGLSVHFICDDDGVLYQCLDIRERAYHIGTNNAMSVGVEIDSRAVAGQHPDAYDEAHQRKYGVGPRRIVSDTIHGMRMKGFDYSDAQYAALIKLGRALTDIFPLIKPDFARDANGDIIKTELDNPQKHRGFIFHLQVTRKKIDPISFDSDRFLAGIRGEPADGPSPSQMSRIVGAKSIPLKGSGAAPGRIAADLSTWLARQKALRMLGHDPGVLDGRFGPHTKSALREFQIAQGLDPDGIWGPKTEAAILSALGK